MANDIEAQARQLGWVPKEEFRGDAAKWRDAETFVKKGEEVMPILQANNRRLQAEIAGLRGQLTEAQTTIQAAQESIEALKTHQTENTKRAVEEAKKDLRAQIATAREAGDVEQELELTEQLQEVRDTEREVARKPIAPPTPSPAPKAADNPEFAQWRTENPWYGTDKRRTALAMAEAEELRADPVNKGLVGRAFFDKVAENVEATMNPHAPSSKVESGNGSAMPSSRGGGAKGYSQLPQEAKDMCESQAAKLVGKGRAFPDKAAWQKHYAEQYFLQE